MSVTRRQVVLGALSGGVVGAAPASARASGADGLERLLAFELRLRDAYRAALERGVIDVPLGESLLAQEREHVRGVEMAMETRGRSGSQDIAPPPAPDAAFAGRGAFARFALELETQTVAGYVAVLATLDAPDLLQPLGSIMTSAAQHQVALRRVLGEPLLAHAFERGVA